MTRHELMTCWSFIDVADATEVLDALEDGDARAQAKAKAERPRTPARSR